MKVPEQFRITNHPIPMFSSTAANGANGYFMIPHYKIEHYFFGCMVTDGMNWDHVSVSIKVDGHKKIKHVDRCPTWEEMCYVKSLFWDDEEPVMQLHPAKSTWVNNHPYCLHMWRPQNAVIPLPLPLMVGHPDLDTKENKTK